jgi:large conductance mechanosensitive channel
MSFFSEFKTFAIRGNVVDLAVGVIIGTAFGNIVSSLVSDILMPPIGLMLGGIDFSSFKIDLGRASINYGFFINTIVNFALIILSLFLFVKIINRIRHEKVKVPDHKDCPYCLMSIPIKAERCGFCTSSLKS